MDIRTLTFNVLPADALAVDVISKANGIEESDAARFVYQCGLHFLENDEIGIRMIPELRLQRIQESLQRQKIQLTGLSRYGLDRDGMVEEVYPRASIET